MRRAAVAVVCVAAAACTVRNDQATGAPASAAPAEAALTADVAAAAEVTTTVPPAPELACYGNPWSGDSLSNYRIGTSGWAWSFRWRAPRDGVVNGLRVYWVDNSKNDPEQGYARGNGGTIEVALRPDNGSGFPDLEGEPLATHLKEFPTMSGGTISPRDTVDKREHLFNWMEFSNPVEIDEGELYHMTFRNVAPDPTNNLVSINVLLLSDDSRSRCVPSADSWGLTLFSGNGGFQRQSDRSDHQGHAAMPIMEVSLDDGTTFGNGYLEAWLGSERPIQDSARVRQVFSPSEALELATLGLRLNAQSDAGSVSVTLRDATSVLHEVQIPAASFVGRNGAWAEVPFEISLEPDITYTVEISALDGAQLTARSMLDGSGMWTFDRGTTWSEGFAQSSADDGASWDGWHSGDQTDPRFMQGDLQLYFQVVPTL